MSIEKNRRHRAGMTLFEVVIALALTSLVVLAVTGFATYSGHSLANLANYVDLNFDNRTAVDRMTRELRQARSLTKLQAQEIAFLAPNGEERIYRYDPARRALVRQTGDVTEILLSECEYIKFSGFKQNPKVASLSHDTTTNPAATKLVRLDWKCSRMIWGNKLSTETLQSAKIVLRNS